MALAAGCSNTPVEGKGVFDQSNTAPLSGTLNLNGSTSVAEISNALAKAFLEFAGSQKGRQIIAENGAVPNNG